MLTRGMISENFHANIPRFIPRELPLPRVLRDDTAEYEGTRVCVFYRNYRNHVAGSPARCLSKPTPSTAKGIPKYT